MKGFIKPAELEQIVERSDEESWASVLEIQVQGLIELDKESALRHRSYDNTKTTMDRRPIVWGDKGNKVENCDKLELDKDSRELVVLDKQHWVVFDDGSVEQLEYLKNNNREEWVISTLVVKDEVISQTRLVQTSPHTDINTANLVVVKKGHVVLDSEMQSHSVTVVDRIIVSPDREVVFHDLAKAKVQGLIELDKESALKQRSYDDTTTISMKEKEHEPFRVSSWGHLVIGLSGGSPSPDLKSGASSDLSTILGEEYSTIGDSFEDNNSDDSEPVANLSNFLLLDEEFSTIGDSFEHSDNADEYSTTLSNELEDSAQRLDTADDFAMFDFVDDQEEIQKFTTAVSKSNCLSSSNAPNPCCDRACNVQILSNKVRSRLDRMMENKNKSEIKQVLLDQLFAQLNMDVSTNGFLIGGQFLCKDYFCKFSTVSSYLIKEVFKAFSVGQKFIVHGNSVGLRQAPATTGFICWVKEFSTNFGNFSPDEQVIVISAVFTVKEMYLMYQHQAPPPLVKKSTFYQLLKSKFGPKRDDLSLPWVRISSYSTHSRCDQCLCLERYQRSCQSAEDLAMAKGLKQEHKQTFVRARLAIEEKRFKALNDPDNHVMIQIDDMDNHKVINNQDHCSLIWGIMVQLKRSIKTGNCLV